MNGVEEITATKSEARVKYREYRTAAERQPLPYLKELKDAYNQLRRGHGVIDVFKAFKTAGVNAEGEPRLALYPADLTKCEFRKESGGPDTSRIESAVLGANSNSRWARSPTGQLIRPYPGFRFFGQRFPAPFPLSLRT